MLMGLQRKFITRFGYKYKIYVSNPDWGTEILGIEGEF